ncbi:hypothetical protein [Azotobacter salinestris]|uniref:hypothetical protein n=1 Tax=Azotobacter salinestris TaxID=69964 RepID=UPI001266D8F3|nr:hypothetical protein [Azotobacter salinestris]
MPSITITNSHRPTDPETLDFEREMRALGYRTFRKENGQYCLQILNEMKKAYQAGLRNGCEAA